MSERTRRPRQRQEPPDPNTLSVENLYLLHTLNPGQKDIADAFARKMQEIRDHLHPPVRRPQ